MMILNKCIRIVCVLMVCCTISQHAHPMMGIDTEDLAEIANLFRGMGMSDADIGQATKDVLDAPTQLLREWADSNDETLKDMAKTGWQGVLEMAKSRQAGKQAERQAAIEQHGMTKRFKLMLDELKKPKSIALLVGGISMIILAYYLFRHGSGIAARYIEARLDRPKIILESSRRSLKERIFGKKEKEESRLGEVIAAPALKEKLQHIADDTLSAYESQENLSNVLLYGPPGTGKTMFAKALALHCGLDYAILPGSSLSKLDTTEALKELDKLFAWAQQSEKGLVIFIDEAEAFLRDRGSGAASEHTKKLLTEFLAHVEKPSNAKLMFVFATNRIQDIDSAVLSRIGHWLNVPKPAVAQREALIKLYASKLDPYDISCDESFEQGIARLAQHADGMVGRDIEEVFANHMVRQCRREETDTVTFDLARRVLDAYKQEQKDRDAAMCAA